MIPLIGLVGPLLAAGIALAGLRFTLWKHRKDAEMALRKEVYANASDVMAEAMFALTFSLLPNRTSEDFNVALQRFAGSLGKLLTVARPETQKTVLNLQRSFTAAYSDLAKRKGVLSARAARIDTIDATLKQRVVDREEALEFRKGWTTARLIEAGTIGSGIDLDQRLAVIAQSVELLLAEGAQLVQENMAEFLAGMEALNLHFKELHPLNVDLLIAFRGELGVYTDIAWFRQEMGTNFALSLADSTNAIEVERKRLELASSEQRASFSERE